MVLHGKSGAHQTMDSSSGEQTRCITYWKLQQTIQDAEIFQSGPKWWTNRPLSPKQISNIYNLADILLLPPHRSISNIALANKQKQKFAPCHSQRRIVITSWSAFKNSSLALAPALLKIDKLQTQRGFYFKEWQHGGWEVGQYSQTNEQGQFTFTLLHVGTERTRKSLPGYYINYMFQNKSSTTVNSFLLLFFFF